MEQFTMTRKFAFGFVALSLMLGLNMASIAAEDVSSQIEKCEALLREDEGDLALKEAEAIVEKAPESAVAHRLLGDSYLKLQRCDEAIKSYDKAISLDPKDPRSRLGRAHGFLLKGDVAQSVKDYDKSIELSPKDGVYFNSRALLHYYLANESHTKKDFKEALREVELSLADSAQAIKLGHDYSSARIIFAQGNLFRAKLLEETKANESEIKKAYNDAVDGFTLAIDARSSSEESVADANRRMVLAKLGVAQAYFFAKEYQNTIASIDKYIDGMPRRDKASAYLLRFMSNKKLGHDQEAEDDYAKYRAAKPKS
jgi:tetratricopeptide (TPR) repeat protein